ncbi:P2Y purinoceptor 4 [Polyodon spathula]|uniref:P2Y purinoceptor 4 n=1 Tax=Polyodon spathula TaxID=7913 RepID=UPI001B7DA941|nr:P2Y purinoceptor 4 [Polyodon spathula]XP_041098522.1 P2Y purinoceptor 4 [Polyodon spathula]XP_041098523.1 P2Y purinoceptor 4 [Polyodon spathula]
MNNSSLLHVNGTSPCPAEPQSIIIPVFLVLVFLGGFILNSASLWIFWFRIPHWNSGMILQFHLVLSDAMVIPAAPFMAIYYSLGSHWPFGQFLCQLKAFFLSTHLYSSIYFLMLISVHRYVAVVHYTRVSRMKSKDFVHKLCLGVWFFLSIKGMALFFILETSEVGNRIKCLSIHQDQLTGVYFVMNFVLLVPGFLLPFAISVTCYSLLVSSVSKMKTNTLKGKVIKSKSLKMIAVCMSIFVACFTPLHVARTLGVVVKKFFPSACALLTQVESAYYISWTLAGANCCLDPMIYCFGSEKFNKTFRGSLNRIGFRFHRPAAARGMDSTSQSMTSRAGTVAL